MQEKEEEPSQKDIQLQNLLETRFIGSIEELNYILFDEEESSEYERLNKKKLVINKAETAQHKDKPFQQICAYYCNKEERLIEVKRLLRHKFHKEDIFQTHQLRKSMWILLSKAIFKIQTHPNYYQQIHNSQYPQYYSKIIQNDVKRTLQHKSVQNQEKLSNILRCLSIRNPYVGYCQGMNFIVNFLVMMQFNEEECFWIANELFEEIVPKNYYTNMLGVAIDIKLVQVFLQQKRPELYRKIKELNISISIFALEWFVCLCTTILPYNILVLVWDLLFCEGSIVLIKTTIVLIDEMEEMLFRCGDLNDFLVELEPFKKKVVFEEFSFLAKIKNVYINRGLINFARRAYEVLMRIDSKETKKKIATTCNPKWPICHYQLHKNKLEQKDPEPWVFKQDGPPRVIQNYLDLKSKKHVKMNKEDNRDQKKKLVIGRMPHTCEPSTYELIQQRKTNIELNDYDPQTNSYLLPPSSFNEGGFRFLQSATFIEETFMHQIPNK